MTPLEAGPSRLARRRVADVGGARWLTCMWSATTTRWTRRRSGGWRRRSRTSWRGARTSTWRSRTYRSRTPPRSSRCRRVGSLHPLLQAPPCVCLWLLSASVHSVPLKYFTFSLQMEAQLLREMLVAQMSEERMYRNSVAARNSATPPEERFGFPCELHQAVTHEYLLGGLPLVEVLPGAVPVGVLDLYQSLSALVSLQDVVRSVVQVLAVLPAPSVQSAGDALPSSAFCQ